MITKQELIKSFVFDNINKSKMSEIGFILTDKHKSLSFFNDRKCGKTRFLIQFIISEFLYNSNTKYCIVCENESKQRINNTIYKYLTHLNILYDVIENRTQNYILLKNGSIVRFTTEILIDSDIIVIDESSEYFHYHKSGYNLVNIFLLNKNKRLIMTNSYPIFTTENKYYIEKLKDLNIPNFNITDDFLKMYTRECKIKNIKNKIKNKKSLIS